MYYVISCNLIALYPSKDEAYDAAEHDPNASVYIICDKHGFVPLYGGEWCEQCIDEENERAMDLEDERYKRNHPFAHLCK